MHLTLRYHASAQRPACAAFLRGTDPAAWLRELGRWGVAAGQLACYLVPESIRSVRPAGLFVVLASGTLPPDVLEPYGMVAARLYVPTQATLWPATTPEELAGALLWPRQLLHPNIGMVGFDTADALDLAALLDCRPPRPTNWSRARPGIPPKPRLQQVRVLPPTVAEVVQAIQEDVGTMPLAQLPGHAEAQAGPLQRAVDWLRGGLLKIGLALVRGLPSTAGFPMGRAGRVVGWVLLLLMVGALLVSFVQWASPGNFSGLVVPLTLLAVRLWRSFVEKAEGRNDARPIMPGRTGGSSGPGMFQRLERWLGGRIQNLEQKRQTEIERLLRLFGENMEEALKYAIPLGGPYQDRGTSPESARLGQRATDFNLGGLGGGGRVDAWNLDAYRHNLSLQYRAAATQEIEAGRFKKAAYIYAHLLGDYQAAANTLDQGGFYREAAALFKDLLHNRPAAAKCLEHGGLLLEAAELYAELKEHEKAGDLHQRLDQPELAARHYERGVTLLLDNSDHPAAARILADKLTDAGRAQDVLLTGWEASKQPEVCLKQYFDVVAATPETDLSAHVRAIFQQRTPRERRVPLLQVLAAVNEKHANPELLTTSRDVAYDVVSTEATAGNLHHLPLLRHFLPDDRLIAADCSRFVTSPARPRPAATIKSNVLAPQLDASIEWQMAVTHRHQWLALGWRDNRLHLARGNWYGNVEYYSWMADATGTEALLIADATHSSRVLLRTSNALALETKVLPKNKYFPEALTVDCPSWLPAWPTRVCLLPDGEVATAAFREGTVSVQRYAADGKPLDEFSSNLAEADPAFGGSQGTWPHVLLYRNNVFYTYFGSWVIWLAKDGRRVVYNAEESVLLLSPSPYSAKLQLALGMGGGFRLWEPTRPVRNDPGPQCSIGYSPWVDIQFVGPEYLVAAENSQAELYYLTEPEHQRVRTIDFPNNSLVAVLPTIDRQQFALLESTGRISLHQLSDD